jgi:hypothetical protein
MQQRQTPKVVMAEKLQEELSDPVSEKHYR